MLLNECSKRFFTFLCIQRMCRQRILHTTNDVCNRRTFYEVLGLNRNCTAKDIRNAYLQKCKLYHPDSSQSSGCDSKLKFQEINEAYSILGNEQKRHEYDLTIGSTTSSSAYGSSDYPNYRSPGDLNEFYQRMRRREFRQRTHFTEEELRKRAEDVRRHYQEYQQYHRETENTYDRMREEYRRRIEEEWLHHRRRREAEFNKQFMEGEQLFYRTMLFFSFFFVLIFLSGVLEDGADFRAQVEEEQRMFEEMARREMEKQEKKRRSS